MDGESLTDWAVTKMEERVSNSIYAIGVHPPELQHAVNIPSFARNGRHKFRRPRYHSRVTQWQPTLEPRQRAVNIRGDHEWRVRFEDDAWWSRGRLREHPPYEIGRVFVGRERDHT